MKFAQLFLFVMDSKGRTEAEIMDSVHRLQELLIQRYDRAMRRALSAEGVAAKAFAMLESSSKNQAALKELYDMRSAHVALYDSDV